MAKADDLRARRSKISELYIKGVKTADIAKSVGVHSTTVTRDIRTIRKDPGILRNAVLESEMMGSVEPVDVEDVSVLDRMRGEVAGVLMDLVRCWRSEAASSKDAVWVVLACLKELREVVGLGGLAKRRVNEAADQAIDDDPPRQVVLEYFKPPAPEHYRAGGEDA